MTNATFNASSPLRLLSSFQYTMSNEQSTSTSNQQEISPVAFELITPTDGFRSTNPIDIPGASSHCIKLNDQDLITTSSVDLTLPTDQDDLVLFTNSFGQSPYIVPTDELTVYFDGLAVQSPTGACLYSPQQIYSPVNIGSPQSPSFLNALGSPQPSSPSFLNAQSPFLNANALFGSPSNPQQQLYSEHNNYVDSIPFMSGFVVGSPATTAAGNMYVENPSNQVFGGNSPSLQSYNIVSPNNSPTQFLNSPVLTNTCEEVVENTLGLVSHSTTTTYLSPIATPSPTSSYYNMLPTNTHQESRPTSPLPDDVILTTSEVNQYYHLQPDLTCSSSSNEDAVEPPQPQKKNKKSTVKSTTPSGRKAKIHTCPYCQHTSNRANNMREHIQIHDPNRPKPHTCKLCRKSFARKHDMNRHVVSCKHSTKKKTSL